jgi:hypothetical protein
MPTRQPRIPGGVKWGEYSTKPPRASRAKAGPRTTYARAGGDPETQNVPGARQGTYARTGVDQETQNVPRPPNRGVYSRTGAGSETRNVPGSDRVNPNLGPQFNQPQQPPPQPQYDPVGERMQGVHEQISAMPRWKRPFARGFIRAAAAVGAVATEMDRKTPYQEAADARIAHISWLRGRY